MATGDNQCYDSGTNSDENALVCCPVLRFALHGACCLFFFVLCRTSTMSRPSSCRATVA